MRILGAVRIDLSLGNPSKLGKWEKEKEMVWKSRIIGIATGVVVLASLAAASGAGFWS